MVDTSPGDTPPELRWLIPIWQRHWRRLIAWIVLGAALGLAVVLIRGPRWEASARVAPASRAGTAGLAGLAAQFGVALPVNDAAPSPAFFAELMGSRDVLGVLVRDRFVHGRDGVASPARLTDIHEVRGDNDAVREERTMRRLRRSVRASPSLRSGVVHVAVVERDAQLAAAVLTRLLVVADSVQRERLRAQAAGEQAFAEAQIAQAAAAWQESAAALTRFEREQRGWRQATTTALEHERLAAEVSMRQSMHGALVQAGAQARLDAERDVASLTVVERPSVPAEPMPRRLSVLLVLGALMGLGAGLTLGLPQREA